MRLSEYQTVRLLRAKEDLEIVRKKILDVVTGAQDYRIGSRSVSHVRLETLYKERDRLEDIISSLENPGGRVRRIVPIDK